MRVAALVTGGKDSVLALYRAQKMGHDVEVLATMIPKVSDRQGPPFTREGRHPGGGNQG